jgi:hypothetical protein
MYCIIKKSKFKKIRLVWKKICIIFSISISFCIPFLLGATYPQANPNVEISPKPMEILYIQGNQVQEVKIIDVYIKSTEGNARNINITIQTPVNFYYWVDGIQNDSKFIDFLNYDIVTHFMLEIQPSISVGNGTYEIKITWSYEGDLGDIFHDSISISVFIGPKFFDFLPYWFLIVAAIVGVVASIFVYYFIRKKKSNFKVQN